MNRSTHPRLAGAALAAALIGGASVTGSVTAAPADLDAAATAVDQLGAHLQLALAESDPSGNLVLSPLSISAALAMASAGAGGETLAEMQQVLGLTMADPHGSMGGLLAAVEDAGGGSLALANSAWVQAGLALEPTFEATVTGPYGAAVQSTDFAADPDAARDEVNQWVADATADRIVELLGPGTINPLTRLVLVNAVYLDAEWQTPFEADATYPDEFTTGTGSTVQVDVMHQTLFAEHFDGKGFVALTLPYTSSGQGFEMIVVLPEPGSLAAFEQAYAEADGDLFALLDGGDGDSREVVLSLPKWDITTSASLVDPLQELGMVLPFGDDADFSGITADEPLQIDDVVHQADITVDELGTEAAAATAVIMEPGAAPPEEEPIVFDVDRPFFFAVVDSASGAALFAGHVNDPS